MIRARLHTIPEACPSRSDLSAELDQARRHWRNGELGPALLTYRRLAARSTSPSPEALVELAVVELATREYYRSARIHCSARLA